MTNRISELTAAQEAKLTPYEQKWTDIGLSTKPANRPKAEAAVRALYSQEGLDGKKLEIVWFDSPMAIVQHLAGQDIVADFCYGSHDAGWLSFYSFMREQLSLVKETDDLMPLMQLAQSCGWFAPYEHMCFMSERHSILNLDEQGRLHCLTGPALAYPDGEALYAFRGTLVPEAWILAPDTVPVSLALTHPNVEERNALALILGWDKVLADTAMVTIEDSGDPQLGVLVSAIGRKFLRVRCPTERDAILAVPQECETVLAAQAFVNGVTEAQIMALRVRT